MKTFFKTLIPFAVAAMAATNLHSQQNDQPIFKDGEAQIVPAFDTPSTWIREDLWVETEFDTDGDGELDRMHVDVTRPAQTESGLKLPVIYETSPYYAGVAANDPNLFYDVKHEIGAQEKPIANGVVVRRGKRPVISNSLIKTWIPRGYIVVHSSSPGTGLSEGSPTVGGDNESLAPKAVVDWLNGRAKGYKEIDSNEEVKAFWSTGKVGMTGTSYNGTLPLAAATTGVDGLEAIIPVAPNTSYYHYYRSNGLVRSPGGYLGEDIDVLYNFIHSGDESKRAYADSLVRDIELKNGMDRATGDYNDFWAERDYLNDMKPMKAALLMSHGFNDWNVMPEHSYRIYKRAQEMGIPSQIFYHQNGHGGPPPMKMMNRWFTKYLHGIDNGVENDPKAQIVRENDARDQPTPYENYPNPQAEDITLYLGQSIDGAGTLSIQKAKKSPKETLVDDATVSAKDMMKGSASQNRLLYLTSTLKEELHISGTPKVTISVSSSKEAANLSVYLVSLPYEEGKGIKITDNLITRGWADPQNHASIRKSEPLKKGEFYEVTFDLMPDDQIIRKGQQIGLMIFSSDSEFTVLPNPGTELTVDLSKTKLTLPVVGGETAFSTTIN
ncbi:X-Pro dipeptidyl-peptidase [Dokdonia sp. Hel_I_63]|uniref:Xaa-Pro dipeptidyl-peptidase n=1 Tax=unclassified Dokdonia TaxID=2615033 RepID=UPI00020A6889|nr:MULTISPECIES: Xaa-Pro dipeptidyl-peptidase [unclassified Dokdonia]AEE20672.1 Xaa-Pro dipeptidyl-peptidase [Dokdonia sp. 4H-3-7-5]TVZ23072.1 X-Pro dipeptidyl-peptidase [Dokdonia sp. Hel_I_63]